MKIIRDAKVTILFFSLAFKYVSKFYEIAKLS